MIYNPTKFAYVKLSRETVDGQRKYATPDGERLPSVTTILDATKPQERKDSLHRWRRRVGERAAIEISTEASGRGTRMHKWLEDWIKTGTLAEPGTNPYSIQSHKMADAIIKSGLSRCNEFWGTEIPLWYPRLYAGTTDLAGIHDGHPAIMDHKQTNKPKRREWIEDYFLQLVAYGAAHNALWNTNINRGVIFMCSAAGEYQEFIIDGAEYAKYENLWFTRLEQYYSQFV